MAITQKNIGTIVHDTRLALGLTQSQLAEKAGCSQRLISQLERGSGAEFGKVIDVLGALEIVLEPKPATSNNATSMVNDLSERVEKTLTSPQRPKPSLKQLL